MKSVNCILIDDDKDDQDIFSIALKPINRKVSCICFGYGPEAIAELRGNDTLQPDIIFVDMNMPLMDGKECLQEIKKIDHLRSVPVIIYSTGADPVKIAELKQLGASDFFEKPYDIDLLTEKLSAYISMID